MNELAAPACGIFLHSGFQYWDSAFPEAHTPLAPVSLRHLIKHTDFITYLMGVGWHANWQAGE
ncbi:MAG: hypothetical protein AB7U82_02800 [Blastocatellales bacterium]